MNPEDFLAHHISRIARTEDLKARFKLFFPELDMELYLPQEHESELLKFKQVDGIGRYYFFSRRGKMQFHEFILDIICNELAARAIKFLRPNKKRGSDLIIGKWRIELEICSNPPRKPESRNNLVQRVKRYPEDTIILLLNQKDKQRYLHSPLREMITGNRRFLTVSEFLANPPFP